ncbi:MAG: helix-turn-helix transcriptional regulator [Planctomycetota bacterium]|jgi:predicted DNA-binding transcriptional regulator AlpA
MTVLLSAVDLAREFRISPRTIRRLDLQGKLPRPIRVGRAVRWRRAEMAAWVAAGAPPRDRWAWEPDRQERDGATAPNVKRKPFSME